MSDKENVVWVPYITHPEHLTNNLILSNVVKIISAMREYGDHSVTE